MQYTLNTTPHVSLGGISPFEAERGCDEPLQPWDVANPQRRLVVPPKPLPRSSEVSEKDVRRRLNQQALTMAKQKQRSAPTPSGARRRSSGQTMGCWSRGLR